MILRKLLVSLWAPSGLVKSVLGRITSSKGIKAMLENKYDIPKQPLVAAGIISAVGALAAGAIRLDRYLGSRDITEDTAGPDFYIDHKPGADKTLVLLGGLCMQTDAVAERYRSQLAEDTNLIAPIFPETNFNPQTIFERTFRQLEMTKPKEILIAGLSMGGNLGWDLLDYGVKTGRQELVEKVSGFGAWGTPFGKNAIRFAPRMLLNTVSRLGYSYTLDRSRSILINHDYKSLMDAHPAKVVPQCRYLAGNHAGSLQVTPEHIVFIRGALPDPIVNEDAAARALEQKAGRRIEQVVNTDSTRAEHAPTDKKSAWFMLNQLGIAKPVAENQPLPMPLAA